MFISTVHILPDQENQNKSHEKLVLLVKLTDIRNINHLQLLNMFRNKNARVLETSIKWMCTILFIKSV